MILIRKGTIIFQVFQIALMHVCRGNKGL